MKRAAMSLFALLLIVLSTFLRTLPKVDAFQNFGGREFFADAPHRIDPGNDIPLTVGVHDADGWRGFKLYKIEIVDYVRLKVVDDKSYTDADGHPKEVKARLWYDKLSVDPNLFEKDPYGKKEVWICVRFVTSFLDELVAPIVVRVGSEMESMPKWDGWYAGDAHIHSSMTDNDAAWGYLYGEFGAPIDSIASSARAMGLDWVIITDHSHDINNNNDIDNNFPDEWNRYKTLCDAETTNEFVCMLGEEITCQDKYGSIFDKFESASHYLAYGISSPIKAPNWWYNPVSKGNPTQQDAINEVERQKGIGFIAHPYDLLWDWENWDVQGYTGIEIWNGEFDGSDAKALDQWNKILRQSIDRSIKKVYGIGNSDAHTLTDIARPVRSYVYLKNSQLTASNIIKALGEGRLIVTDGPFLSFTAEDHVIGDKFSIEDDTVILEVSWNSTSEYGAVEQIVVNMNGEPVDSYQPTEGERFSGTKSNWLFTLPSSGRAYFTVNCSTGSDRKAYTNPIWIRQAPASNVDVVLVVDRSSTMADPINKINSAKASANLFTDLMHTGDYIGVVSYADNPTVDHQLAEITSTDVKGTVKDKINGISAYGWTAIGDGLRVAYNQLINYGVEQSHPRAIVLLSDGMHNHGTEHPDNVLPDLKSKGIKVYTIGLGSDVEPILLNKIADETGGFYRFAADSDDLMDIYQDIAATVTQEQTVRSVIGSIFQGETVQVPATIDSSVYQATFLLSWGGSDLDLTLTKPDGSPVTPETASSDPSIEYIGETAYKMYRIQYPMTGSWTMNIVGVSVPLEGEAFTARCLVMADIVLQMSTDKNSYDFHQQMQINATIEDWGNLVLDASVEASMTSPDGSEITTILFDDGSSIHGDQVKDDGTYTNYFRQYTVNGSYTVRVTASGTSSAGEQFIRQTQKTVSASGGQWDYTFSDSYRGITLRVDTKLKVFQFMTSDRDYGIRKATDMQIGRTITINDGFMVGSRDEVLWIMHEDNELRLTALAFPSQGLYTIEVKDVQINSRYRALDWRWERINRPIAHLYIV